MCNFLSRKMQRIKQSKLGIISFIFATILVILSLFLVLFYSIETLPFSGGCKGCGSSNNDKGALPFLYLFGIFVTIIIPYLGSIGFIFGLTSLFQKRVKNIYGIIGLSVCSIYLLYLFIVYF